MAVFDSFRNMASMLELQAEYEKDFFEETASENFDKKYVWCDVSGN